MLGEGGLRLGRMLYGLNAGRCEFGVPVSLASGISSFPRRVPTVFEVRSRRKMGWINARRVVARVHHNKPIRYDANGLFIGKPMGADGPFPGKKKYPVAIRIPTAAPYPAIGALIDAPPECRHLYSAPQRRKNAPLLAAVIAIPAHATGYNPSGFRRTSLTTLRAVKLRDVSITGHSSPPWEIKNMPQAWSK
jgi:hypothetical protein